MFRFGFPLATFIFRHWTFENCKSAVTTAVVAYLAFFSLIFQLVAYVVLTLLMYDFYSAGGWWTVGGDVWIVQNPVLFVIMYIYSTPFKLFGDDYGVMTWVLLQQAALFGLHRGFLYHIEWWLAVGLYSAARPWYVGALTVLSGGDRMLRRLGYRWFDLRSASRRSFWHHWHRRPYLREVSGEAWVLALAMPGSVLVMLGFESPTLLAFTAAAAIGGLYRDARINRRWLYS
mgnify:CR=1